jgi:hypothetical protein
MGQDTQYAAINRRARINSPRRVAKRPSAAGFYSAQKTMRGKTTMRGRRCDRTTTALSRRQVGATRRAGTFLAVSRVFVSSGVPERAPGGRGWPGLAGWINAQIRTKTRNRGHD